MKFALVTPTYNRPENLARCLESLFSLNYQDWIVVIVNDGSTVDYSSIKHLLVDERINYLKLEQNKGVNNARNKALAKIKELDVDYVCFIDDDESFHTNALDIAKEHIDEKHLDWLVLQCFLNNNQTTYMSRSGEMDYIDDYLYGKNLKKDATHFIRKDLATAHIFSTFVRNGEEWVYFAALSRTTKMWAEQIPVKFNYHQEGGLFLGNMNKNSYIRPYLMKLYRPYRAVSLRPSNIKAISALLLQLIKLPFRLPQIGIKYLIKS